MLVKPNKREEKQGLPQGVQAKYLDTPGHSRIAVCTASSSNRAYWDNADACRISDGFVVASRGLKDFMPKTPDRTCVFNGESYSGVT